MEVKALKNIMVKNEAPLKVMADRLPKIIDSLTHIEAFMALIEKLPDGEPSVSEKVRREREKYRPKEVKEAEEELDQINCKVLKYMKEFKEAYKQLKTVEDADLKKLRDDLVEAEKKGNINDAALTKVFDW